MKTPASTKDYIYIDDLAGAILTVLEKGHQGAVNLGTGAGVTVERIARTLAELMDRPELVERAADIVSGPLDYVVADATRLRGLGWQPRYDLATGLRELLAARAPANTK